MRTRAVLVSAGRPAAPRVRHRTAGLKSEAVRADNPDMEVFVRPDIHSQAPPTADQERNAPIFSGTPAEVAQFLGGRMEQRTHTLALVSAELNNLAGTAWATDSLTFVLKDSTSVTVWP